MVRDAAVAAVVLLGVAAGSNTNAQTAQTVHLLLDPRVIDGSKSDNTTVQFGPVAKANGGKHLAMGEVIFMFPPGPLCILYGCPLI
jgi:hypothetical protein